MIRLSGIKMTTKVERGKLLEALRVNLEKHGRIVQEARDGYIKQARQAVERRLEELRQGKLVALTFSLEPPHDYSEVYKNSIEMLEWNTEQYVELEADEFRQLVRDEWDWSDHFLKTSMPYSSTATVEARSKGL